MLAIPEEENQNESIRINQLCMSSARNVSAGSSQGEERNMSEEGHAFFMLTKEQQEVNKSMRMSLMPIPTTDSSSSSCLSSFTLPQEFCTECNRVMVLRSLSSIG